MMASTQTKMKTATGFGFDPSRCSGCMACVVACLDENDLSGGHSFRSVIRQELLVDGDDQIRFISLACFHCGEAPCLTVCPRNAIYKNEANGLVLVDPGYCIGCRACLLVCPFGAPQYSGGGIMQKCHMCYHRLQYSMEPACVRICPTRALDFGTPEELAQKHSCQAGKRILNSYLKEGG
jgi:Fe-S-cluster-containing dehydrogenase component